MDCKRHETALREHALGTPPSPAFAAHLASCEACREKLAVEQGLRVAIDTTLDRLRQIEPSPAFLARARTAALEASAPSRFGWLDRPAWNPAIAAVLLGLTFGVVIARDWKSPKATGPTLHASPPPPAPAPPARPEPPAATPTAASVPATPRPGRAPESRLAVLVPPGQEEAIFRLARLVATGAVAPPTSLLDPPDPSRPLTPPTELSLPPLAIEPLRAGAVEIEGVMP